VVLDLGKRGILVGIDPTRRLNSRIIYLAGRTCLLGPNAVGDATDVVKLAEQAVSRDPKAWHLHTLGLALYRAGQYDQAIKRLLESNKADANWTGQINNWIVLAMAYHQLNQKVEAKKWLDKYDRWAVEARKKMTNGAVASFPDVHPHDWIACHVLRGEAKALFEGQNN